MSLFTSDLVDGPFVFGVGSEPDVRQEIIQLVGLDRKFVGSLLEYLAIPVIGELGKELLEPCEGLDAVGLGTADKWHC